MQQAKKGPLSSPVFINTLITFPWKTAFEELLLYLLLNKIKHEDFESCLLNP